MKFNGSLNRGRTKMKYLTFLFLVSLMMIHVPGALAQQASPKTHIVKPGETLYSISREYHVTVPDLRNWNKLHGNEISIGESILVQPPNTVSAVKKPAQATPKTSTPVAFLNTSSPGTDFYTVQKGDNLYKIARDFNMDVGQLRKLNSLKSSVIHIGERLRVRAQTSAPSIASNETSSTPQGRFTKYVVKRGENLDDLLKRFQMNDVEFNALNPGTGTNLFRGEVITVLLPPTIHHANPYLVNSTLKDVTLTPAVPYKSSSVGDPTTSGDLYNPDALTAASSTIPLGKVVYVMNPTNDKGIYVKVNDRITENELKLSLKAYTELGLDSTRCSVKILQSE